MRLVTIQYVLNAYFPKASEKFFNTFIKKLHDKGHQERGQTIRPEWNLLPAPSLKLALPMLNDHLIGAFESGDVKSVAGIKRVSGPDEIELLGGSRITVDTIIFCTGYTPDYSLVEGYDPTRNTTSHWSSLAGSNDKPLPRLYQNVISLDEPDSLAFMTAVAFPMPAFQTYDLASMAVAQIWMGNSPLPSKTEMSKAVDEHHAWVCDLAKRGTVHPGMVQADLWMAWADEAAGTGVGTKLGYGLEGWKFWWNERKLCDLLMTGVYTPHIYRLFDGKRKKWDGAKQAIVDVNESLKRSKNK